MKYFLVLFLAAGAFLWGCKKDKAPLAVAYAQYENGEELSAGNLTVHDESGLAFSYQVKGVSQDEKLLFFVGNSFFQDNWVEAPSSTTARDGLGPLFNSKSCAGCHFRDGRGQPFKNKGMLFRLSLPGNAPDNGPLAELIYGGQLQDNGISTVQNEGTMNISYTEIAGTYPDGTSYSLRKPAYSISGINYGGMDGSLLISPRVGQQMIGLGLLELIRESDLLAIADENDADGDGISGRPNYVWNPLTQMVQMGRFGWKANTATIELQVAGAFNGDIGITTGIFPMQNHTASQTACQGLPDGGTPEIADDDLAKVVLYSRTLGVPIRRNYKNQDVLEGKKLFNGNDCAKCHTPKFTTGNSGSINALKNVTIRPFTDMLLHDMGDDLADNRPDYLANGREWRTQPLWGLGLIKIVGNHTYLLHDGRARSIEEAILWHGGEAENSKNKFKQLSKKERQQLIWFLESL
ncbi:MAG: di-heme oxidoredictase family protein [Bacteroidota bacterium]